MYTKGAKVVGNDYSTIVILESGDCTNTIDTALGARRWYLDTQVVRLPLGTERYSVDRLSINVERESEYHSSLRASHS